MKTVSIKFYTNDGQYMGWKKWKNPAWNYSELKSWIISGNYVEIVGIKMNTLSDLKNFMKA